MAATATARKNLKKYYNSDFKKMLDLGSLEQNKPIECLAQVRVNEQIYELGLNALDIVHNWDNNRKVDEQKIEEIIKTIKNRTYVDTMIYVYEDFKTGKLHCYDGNHRREAIIRYKNSPEYDEKCINKIYVNIRLKEKESVIIERFKILNQCTPVSALYLNAKKTNTPNLKDTIETVVTELGKLYPDMFSTSNNPRRPRVNKEYVKNMLFEHYKTSKDDDVTPEKILSKLQRLNMSYKNGKYNTKDIIDNLSVKQKEKIEKFDCYLFIRDFTKHIDRFK